MVCALYPLCAILLSTMAMPEDAPRGRADSLKFPLAKELTTIRA